MLQLFHRSNSDFRPSGSLRYCLKSCFKLHNESMNIWTHFAGLTFFLGITVYFFSGKAFPLCMSFNTNLHMTTASRPFPQPCEFSSFKHIQR